MKHSICLSLAFATMSFAQSEDRPGIEKAGPRPRGEQVEAEDEKAGTPPKMTAEIGVQTGSVNGQKSFGFQAYRDIPRGFFIRRFDYRFNGEGSRRQFSFVSQDLLQRDMTFNAALENIGKFRIDLNFWSFSRYWSNQDRSVLVQAQPGLLVVSDALRSSVQDTFPGLKPGTTCAAWAGCSVMAANVAHAGESEIRSYRQAVSLSQTYQLSRSLTLRFHLMRQRQSGNRLMSEGAYSRQDTPIGVVFEMSGQELAEPTFYRTTEFGAELNYRRKSWLATVEYTGSLFHDDIRSLIWQNPFRSTPAQAVLNGDPYKDGAQGRFEFAQAQASLPPNNQAHTLTGSLMVFLPHSSKLSGLISWSRRTQDDAFLPFTINPAITVDNALTPINLQTAVPKLPEGVLPTSLAALPRKSLGGLNQILNQDYVATTRPVRPLQLTFHYRDYDFNDLTQPLLLPGYAAYGNSFWRTTRYGQPADAPQNPAGDTAVPIERLSQSYHRQTLVVESALKPMRDLTWKASYRCDFWNRENRPVRESTDCGADSSIAYAPRGPVYVQAGFGYLDRKPTAYDPGHLENLFLRMFDETGRVRTQGNALVSMDLTKRVAASASWSYAGDRYNKAFYGLHQQKSNSLNADVNFNVNENFGFFAGWGYDRIGYDYLLSASLGYLLQNSWSRDTRDGVHSAQMGFSGSFGQAKGSYSFSYGVTLARTRIDTANPYTVQQSAVDYSRAYPFPVVKSQLQELRAEASYQVGPKVRAGFSFLFEPYRLSDFAYDSVSPYDPSSFAPETDTRRYLFTGTGPSSYTGKLLTIYVRYTF